MIGKKRRGLGRESIIGRLLSALVLASFVLFVIPNLKPTLINLVVLFIGAGIITDCIALYLSGKQSWHILLPSVLVVVVIALLFAFTPLG